MRKLSPNSEPSTSLHFIDRDREYLFCQLNGELSNFIKRADDVRNSARVNATHPIDWFKSRVMNVLHPTRVDLHNL